MGAIRQKIKHAFAVDPPGSADPDENQKPAVDWVCDQVAKRRLTLPGLIFLEMTRPLNYLGAQCMHFTQPGVWAIAPKHIYGGYKYFAKFLENRGSMEYMCRRIEEMEAGYLEKENKLKAERKKIKKDKKNKRNKPKPTENHEED